MEPTETYLYHACVMLQYTTVIHVTQNLRYDEYSCRTGIAHTSTAVQCCIAEYDYELSVARGRARATASTREGRNRIEQRDRDGTSSVSFRVRAGSSSGNTLHQGTNACQPHTAETETATNPPSVMSLQATALSYRTLLSGLCGVCIAVGIWRISLRVAAAQTAV